MKTSSFNFGFLLALFSLPIFAAQSVVGKVNFAKGSNAAQQPNESPRVLGKDAAIFQGDTIQTSDNSFVVIGFVDNSKITVRPNSNFKIEQFDNATQKAKLAVYEGGVQAATGEFAKFGADNFQINTPTATIRGEKESDYSVHVCSKGDCAKKTDNTVAKIVNLKGDVFAQNRADNSEKRKLTIGSGLNPQDFLTSQANSYAVMVFRDNQKVSLQANSEFDILKYDFGKSEKKDALLFKLTKGGLRTLTGSIGKTDHFGYEVDTPVATIGIRGTDYDFQCSISQDCANEGAYLQVNDGAVSETNEKGEKVFYKGQSSFVENKQSEPELEDIPKEVIDAINNAPPANTAPNAEQVFSHESANSKSGTCLIVNKGKVVFDDPNSGSSTLVKGESSFAGGDKGIEPIKVESPIPAVVTIDDVELNAFIHSANIPTTTLFSATIGDSNPQFTDAACLIE